MIELHWKQATLCVNQVFQTRNYLQMYEVAINCFRPISCNITNL